MRYLTAAVFLCLVVGSLALFSRIATTSAISTGDDNDDTNLACYFLHGDVSPVGSGGTTGSPGANCPGGYADGTLVTISETPGANYTFANWSGDTNCSGSNPSLTFNISQNTTCTANFVQCFTVELISTPSVWGSSNPIEVSPCGPGAAPAGYTVPLNATANAGYGFINWDSGTPCAGQPANGSFTMPAQNSFCIAYFDVCQSLTLAVVPFDAGSVSFNNTTDCGSGKYATGQTAQIGAVADSGYVFKNWTSPGAACDGSTTASTSFTMGNAAATCTANFVACHSITVALESGGTGGVTGPSPCSGGFVDGTNATFTATPDATHYFSGWTGLCDGQPASFTISITTDGSCLGHFDSCSHLSTDVAGSGTLVPQTAGACSPYYYTPSQSTNMLASASPGWTFTHWGADCGSDNLRPVNLSFSSGDRACSAFFVQCFPLTTAVATDGGYVGFTVGGSDCILPNVPSGSVISLGAHPGPDFTFDHWEGTGVCNNAATNPISVTVTSATTCTAFFHPTCVALTTAVSPAGKGTITRQSGPNCTAMYTYNSAETITEAPAGNWAFSGWSGDCAGNTPSVALTMNAPKSCTANFVGITPRPTRVPGAGSATPTKTPASTPTPSPTPSITPVRPTPVPGALTPRPTRTPTRH